MRNKGWLLLGAAPPFRKEIPNMKRPWAFICASEDTSSRILSQYCRRVYELGYIPVCPRLQDGQYLVLDDPAERSSYNAIVRDKLLRCPMLVHCIMDEFPNIALPDDFDKILATMRSREISVSIMIQNMAQLKALFKDSCESLVGNCDSLLYLGGNEKETYKYISELLGKETLNTDTYSQSKGRNGSYSVNHQQTGRDLMTPDEVRLLSNDKALLFVRGERPILDDKFDLTRHPRVRFTEDGGAPPYDYSETNLAHTDCQIDPDRIHDFELLEDDDFLAPAYRRTTL